MDVRNLDRIGFVTRHFKDLQGLRIMVPLGMNFLILGLRTWIAQRSAALALLWMAALFTAEMLLMSRSGRYYRRIFGDVDMKIPITLGEWLPMLVLTPSGLLFLWAVGSLSWGRAICLYFSSALLAAWYRREFRWFTSYYLVFGVLLLVVAVLAPVGEKVAFDLCGISMIVAGLLDHWQLVHTLGKLPPPDLDEVAAAEVAR
jgi:hypothetical protein